MNKAVIARIVLVAAAFLIGCEDKTQPLAPDSGASDEHRIAQCLTDRGWLMYGSATCSACLAQRKAFGAAFELIHEIECNPHQEDNQVERCLAREVRTTPTWIKEVDDREIQRIEGYALLEDLARETGCMPATGG